MFFSLRNLSALSLIDEKISISPMVLDQVLVQGSGSSLGSSLQLKVGSAQQQVKHNRMGLILQI